MSLLLFPGSFLLRLYTYKFLSFGKVAIVRRMYILAITHTHNFITLNHERRALVVSQSCRSTEDVAMKHMTQITQLANTHDLLLKNNSNRRIQKPAILPIEEKI